MIYPSFLRKGKKCYVAKTESFIGTNRKKFLMDFFNVSRMILFGVILREIVLVVSASSFL